MVICDLMTMDAFAEDFRLFMSSHALASPDGLAVFAAALPNMRSIMSESELVIGQRSVNLNKELGVYVSSCVPDSSHGIKQLFEIGQLEIRLGLGDSVQAIVMNAFFSVLADRQQQQQIQEQQQQRQIPEQQQEAFMPAQAPDFDYKDDGTFETFIPEQDPLIFESILLFKNLIACVHYYTLPVDDLVETICHMKCIILGIVECRAFVLKLEPVLQHFVDFRQELEPRLTLPFLCNALPRLRRAMEIDDLGIDGFNLNKELGVYVHQGLSWTMIPVTCGATEARLGIQSEVFEKFQSMTQVNMELIEVDENQSPSAIRAKQLREKATKKITENIVMKFRELVTILLDTKRIDDAQRTNVISHIKNVISGRIDSEVFITLMTQILGRTGHPFCGPLKSNVAFMRRGVAIMRSRMREQDVIIDGFNINEEVGLFIHTIDENGGPKIVVSCEGRIQRGFGICEQVERLAPEITCYETLHRSADRPVKNPDHSIVPYNDVPMALAFRQEITTAEIEHADQTSPSPKERRGRPKSKKQPTADQQLSADSQSPTPYSPATKRSPMKTRMQAKKKKQEESSLAGRIITMKTRMQAKKKTQEESSLAKVADQTSPSPKKCRGRPKSKKQPTADQQLSADSQSPTPYSPATKRSPMTRMQAKKKKQEESSLAKVAGQVGRITPKISCYEALHRRRRERKR